ncbi:hypothetical protein NC652_009675 [Populus alba x Populus x berolinensis]|nr:hypothetical protein NC652_009675 [Populus alba x Populus x berolinensis]
MSLSPKPLLHRLCFNELPCIYTFRVPTRFHLQKSKSPSSNLSHFQRLCSGTGDNNVSGSSDSRNKNHDHEGSRERSEMSRPSASNEYFLLIHCADILLFVNSMMMAFVEETKEIWDFWNFILWAFEHCLLPYNLSLGVPVTHIVQHTFNANWQAKKNKREEKTERKREEEAAEQSVLFLRFPARSPLDRAEILTAASRHVSLHSGRLDRRLVAWKLAVLTENGAVMGYRFKVDAKSMFGANPKFIEEEVSRKTEEYVNNVEILEIAKQCEMEQELALKAAKIFRATWVILDRQMKKDKRYFMDKLPCGISRMKRNNTIEQLRGSKTRENIKVDEKEEERVPYDEMIPGSPKRRRSARKPPAPPSTGAVREQQFNHGEEITHENHRRSDSFSKSASTSQFMMTTASSSTSTTGYHEHDTSSSTSKTAKHAYMNFQGKENTANTQQATAGKHSLAANTKFEQKEREAESLNEQQRRQKNIDNWMGESPTNEAFKNSICLVCKNRRTKIGWKRDFSYKEIHAATEGFSQTKFLSEGGFGSVYRGDLDGLAFAVKQHNSASFQGEKEFKSEVEVLSKARHENLVMLLGSCSEGNDRLLVYEYVCNGSLDQHLSSKNQ